MLISDGNEVYHCHLWRATIGWKTFAYLPELLSEPGMKIKRIKICDLLSHPLQAVTYGDLPESEFEALKADILRRGIRTPIEVTTSNLILDGHQRVRACRELGITEIDALIREEDDSNDVDECFVLANLIRRQLDPVAKAKALQTLVEIERRRGHEVGEHGNDLRDQIAKRLGGKFSGRTIDRLLQLIRLPDVIQRAVSRRELPMTTALKVESLPATIQQEIANRIATGTAARPAVSEFLQTQLVTESESPSDLYRKLMDVLFDVIDVLEGAGDELTGTAGAHERTAELLIRSSLFCKQMSKREQAAHEDILKSIRKLAPRRPRTR